MFELILKFENLLFFFIIHIFILILSRKSDEIYLFSIIKLNFNFFEINEILVKSVRSEEQVSNKLFFIITSTRHSGKEQNYTISLLV